MYGLSSCSLVTVRALVTERALQTGEAANFRRDADSGTGHGTYRDLH